jgi:uncharacterized protein YkwD
MADPRVGLGRKWRLIALAFLVAYSVVVLVSSWAGASALDAGTRSDFRFKRVERCFMREINRRRVARGLNRLRWDWQMGVVARRHARKMARDGFVSHDGWLGSRLTHWRALGQNSGRGHRCKGLFRAFWRSSGHRANMLGRWRFVAVGARRRDGNLYVQQVFEYRSNPGNIWGLP